MEDMILHMLITAALIKWLLGKKRFWNKKRDYGIYLAFLLLLGVGIYELRKSNKNFYEVLNLNANASKSDIQQSYRRMTRIYHPDKNKSSNSIEDFNKIREAYEVLSNDAKKDYYDRFGDLGESEVNNFFYIDILIIAIFQFAISFLFGLVYTYGKENENNRIIICLYITLNFCIEIILRFSPESSQFFAFIPIFCHYTPFERIQAFRVLVPLVMNFVQLLDIYFFEHDEDASCHLTTFYEYKFAKNSKIIRNLEDVIIYFARLIDGMIDTESNFSWRKDKPVEQFENVLQLNEEQTYEKICDIDNDIFFSSLGILRNEELLNLKVPKRDLCRRFDWSRSFVNNVLEKYIKQKNFLESAAKKGIIFSTVLYVLGLISHLLSK